MQRYARVALSKVLSALGDELSVRITVLRAQMNQTAEPHQLWQALAARLDAPARAGPSTGREPHGTQAEFNQE